MGRWLKTGFCKRGVEKDAETLNVSSTESDDFDVHLPRAPQTSIEDQRPEDATEVESDNSD